MKRSTRYFGILFSLAIVVAGCNSEGKPSPEKSEAPLPKVATTKAKKETATYSLQLPGELAPFEEVRLYPKVSGFVKQIYVDRGSKVKKGQLLARLEAPEITQQSAAASAKQREVMERLQYSQQAYQRLREASKSAGAVAPIELEQAKSKLMSDSASYQSLHAEMAAAKQLADYLEIRAPFAGIISSRTVSQGALVGANEKPLFTLAQQDRLRLTIAIPEKHARALSDSTEISFTVSNYPDEVFKAKYSRSSGVLDRALRSLMVEFDIENQNRRLNGGEYVQATVKFHRRMPSLWVPTSSIVKASSGMFVLAVKNDTIRHIPVKEGIRNTTFTEVFGDLGEQELIVVKGSEELREGIRVTVE